jgi:cell division protein FtsB
MRKKSKLGVTAFVTIFVFGSLYVWQKSIVMIMPRHISAAGDKLSVVTAENQRLNMKITDITSLGHLEAQAKKRLGLVVPEAADVVIIEEESGK